MFIECHDIDQKFPYYVNVDKISDIHINNFITTDGGKTYGFVLEAYIVAIPDNKRFVSEIFHTREEAEKALASMMKKLNKRK